MFSICGFPKYKVEFTSKDCNGIDKVSYSYSDSWLLCKWKMYQLSKAGKKPVMKYLNL